MIRRRIDGELVYSIERDERCHVLGVSVVEELRDSIGTNDEHSL